MRIIVLPLFLLYSLYSVGDASNLIAGIFGLNDAARLSAWEYFFKTIWWLGNVFVAVSLFTFAYHKTFQLVFQMSSGNHVVFTSDDRSKVESMRDDVINGIERGCFPNYLQNK